MCGLICITQRSLLELNKVGKVVLPDHDEAILPKLPLVADAVVVIAPPAVTEEEKLAAPVEAIRILSAPFT